MLKYEWLEVIYCRYAPYEICLSICLTRIPEPDIILGGQEDIRW